MESTPRLGIDLLTLISAFETVVMMIAPLQEFQWREGRAFGCSKVRLACCTSALIDGKPDGCGLNLSVKKAKYYRDAAKLPTKTTVHLENVFTF